MLFVAIYILIILILIALIYAGTKSGKIRHFFSVHPHIPKILLFGYIVFAGCFVFPFRSDPFPFDFQKAYILVLNYGAIASAFAEFWGSGRKKIVYTGTFLFTAIGMLCRYLLEFGEVSNTYNFTLFNIISYLAVIPIGTMIAYQLIVKKLK